VVKAAKGLQVLYPLLEWPSKLRENYSDVDKLMSDVNKMFVKTPLSTEIQARRTFVVSSSPASSYAFGHVAGSREVLL
jgi:hypothetical protein